MPSLPSVAMRNICVRAEDCVGPMNRQSSSPQIQKAMGPDSVIRVSPAAIIEASEPTMTGFDPNRSSTNPPISAPIAAITLALAPNNSTSAFEMPYTLTPRIAPNAKIPARPSRNTALASR